MHLPDQSWLIPGFFPMWTEQQMQLWGVPRSCAIAALAVWSTAFPRRDEGKGLSWGFHSSAQTCTSYSHHNVLLLYYAL